MTNFKGTKGKWVWLQSQRNRLAILENEYGSEICNFGDDTCYYPTEGVEPNEYDKQLIACAPEMLQMLDELIYAFDKENLNGYQEERIEEAKQLIKKATE